MRITRDLLLRLARDTAAQRVRTDRSLICIYLTGSLLGESPLLGGTADIDLIFVHTQVSTPEREIVALNDDVHLDIAHYSQSLYQQPRSLRTNPWIGSFLYKDPLPLHDVGHWFEFTQAGASANFQLPENVYQRARPLAESARAAWLHLQTASIPGSLDAMRSYFKALEQAGNALACLAGAPLPLRRFVLDLPERADALKRPGLAGGWLDLIAPQGLSGADIQALLPDWTHALTSAAARPDCPPRLHKARLNYYTRAAQALTDDQPHAAAWILLNTWSEALALAGGDSPAWQACCQALELDAAHFEQRLNALDSYLDAVEETMDAWAEDAGVL